MRRAGLTGLAILAGLTGCTGFQPVEPTQSASEMPRNAPGLISGSDGVFTILGPAGDPTPAAAGK